MSSDAVKEMLRKRGLLVEEAWDDEDEEDAPENEHVEATHKHEEPGESSNSVSAAEREKSEETVLANDARSAHIVATEGEGPTGKAPVDVAGQPVEQKERKPDPVKDLLRKRGLLVEEAWDDEEAEDNATQNQQDNLTVDDRKEGGNLQEDIRVRGGRGEEVQQESSDQVEDKTTKGGHASDEVRVDRPSSRESANKAEVQAELTDRKEPQEDPVKEMLRKRGLLVESAWDDDEAKESAPRNVQDEVQVDEREEGIDLPAKSGLEEDGREEVKQESSGRLEEKDPKDVLSSGQADVISSKDLAEQETVKEEPHQKEPQIDPVKEMLRKRGLLVESAWDDDEAKESSPRNVQEDVQVAERKEGTDLPEKSGLREDGREKVQQESSDGYQEKAQNVDERKEKPFLPEERGAQEGGQAEAQQQESMDRPDEKDSKEMLSSDQADFISSESLAEKETGKEEAADRKELHEDPVKEMLRKRGLLVESAWDDDEAKESAVQDEVQVDRTNDRTDLPERSDSGKVGHQEINEEQGDFISSHDLGEKAAESSDEQHILAQALRNQEESLEQDEIAKGTGEMPVQTSNMNEEPIDVDRIRVKAMRALLDGTMNGRLPEILRSEDEEKFRKGLRASLLKGCRDGSLNDVLKDASNEKVGNPKLYENRVEQKNANESAELVDDRGQGKVSETKSMHLTWESGESRRRAGGGRHPQDKKASTVKGGGSSFNTLGEARRTQDTIRLSSSDGMRSLPGKPVAPRTLCRSYGSLPSAEEHGVLKRPIFLNNLSHVRSLPKIKFGEKRPTSFFATNDNPGPGSYNLAEPGRTSKFRELCGGNSFGGGASRFGYDDHPGKVKPAPGQYGIPKNPVQEVQRKVAFSMDARECKRYNYVVRDSDPGPGSYEVKSSLGKNTGVTAKGKIQTVFNPAKAFPGPGAYDPKHDAMSKFESAGKIGVGTSIRTNWSELHCQRTPGPGAYHNDSYGDLGRNSKKCSFHIRHKKPSSFDPYVTPGPGSYNAHGTCFGY